MIDYDILEEDFNEESLSDSDFLEAYNAETVITWIKPEMWKVLNFLLTSGVWEKLDNALHNEITPEPLKQKLRKFLTVVTSPIPDLRIHDAEPEQNFETLIGLGIVTQQDTEDFLDLAKVVISPAVEKHGREITQVDLDVMRLQDKIRIATQARNSLNEQISALDSKLQQLWQGVDVEL